MLMVYAPCKTYNGQQIHACTITLTYDQSDEEYEENIHISKAIDGVDRVCEG